MNKRWMIYTLVLLLVVFFGASQALASPVDVTVAKKTPGKTPGAQATERAIERAADQADDDDNEENNGNGNSKGKPVNIKGILVSVDAESLEIKLSDDSIVTVLITEETRIQIPTLGKDAAIENLVPGVQVGVQAREDEDGLLIAKSITVIPGKPTKVHRIGIVTEYLEGESITIEAKDGESYTFAITEDTKILPASRADELEEGVRVTIITPRDVTGGEPTAKGIVIHPTKTTEP